MGVRKLRSPLPLLTMDHEEQHVARKAATPNSARRIKLTASLGTMEVHASFALAGYGT